MKFRSKHHGPWFFVGHQNGLFFFVFSHFSSPGIFANGSILGKKVPSCGKDVCVFFLVG